MSKSSSTTAMSVAVTAIGHMCGVTIVAALIGIVVLDWTPAVWLAGKLVAISEIRAKSATELLLFSGLSACVWALIVIAWQLVQLHLKDSERRTIKLSKGTVVTETLIVLPVFLLLTFGLAQLAVSGLAGILMNVAGYQAARSAWVWQPEEDASNKRMGIEDGVAQDRCRIAIAAVMLPVAPGGFVNNPLLGSDAATDYRTLAGLSNVPLGGFVTDATGGGNLADVLGGIGSISATTAVRANQSVSFALDHDTFAIRTLKKFTHAYHASACEINDDHSVTATYLLHIAMPTMGPIFGTRMPSTAFTSLLPGIAGQLADAAGGVGGRAGYYAAYTREFGFEKQPMTVNGTLPSNNQNHPEPTNDQDAEGQIGGAVGL